ncbi:F-type H+-transporting ATPase subunit gamma [Raphidocelis subcapitata]|uniref:F-type H+-transporting ATPase subunit gamma n=1 Tax=Raphidocelis subcapitata TaxID=307507 RepID=A0A2V0NMH1_9CHLO|nr:F-type H+-transporting ATPase subunit gamma [Raphidocelis subcapitata]|eukprot:GBF88696.1 F-type H+-transporting ATPase subunit gamma [Raphidocelis subcapitata]
MRAAAWGPRRWWSLWIALILLATGPSGALAARRLRQAVETKATQGRNPIRGNYLFTQAREAEAKANPRSAGMHHNEARMIVYASDLYPAARQGVTTRNGEQPGGRARSNGGPAGNSVYAFGVVAHAATDTERARAMSGSDVMPMMPDQAERDNYVQSKAATTAQWDVQQLRRTTGKTNQVYIDSIAVNDLPPLSHGISNVGGGPTAIAEAGQAVAVANADTPVNSGISDR